MQPPPPPPPHLPSYGKIRIPHSEDDPNLGIVGNPLPPPLAPPPEKMESENRLPQLPFHERKSKTGDTDLKSLGIRKKYGFRNHSNAVRGVLYFGFPHFKIISCSLDKRIVVADFKNQKKIEKITEHSDSVYNLLKWDNDTFLSCSRDSKIVSFSLLPSPKVFKIEKRILSSDSYVMQLLKLNSELLLTCNYPNELTIVSYNENKLFRKLKTKIKLFWSTKCVISKTFKNCFYVNENDSVKLMNYQDDKYEKTISQEKEKSSRIYSMDIYINEKTKDENLVFGGFDRKLYFYNLGKSLEEKEQILVKTVEIGNIISSTLIYDKILFIGGYRDVFAYSLDDDNNNNNNSISKFRNIHKHKINDLLLMFDFHKGLNFISCSDDKNVNINTINLKIIKEEDKFLQILNEKTKSYIDNIYNYCEKTREELVSLCRDKIVNETITEFSKNNNNNSNNVQNLEYLQEFCSLFFDNKNKNNRVYIGQFKRAFTKGNFHKKKEYIKDGFGVEFIKSGKKYKLLFIGTYSDGKKEGTGELFITKKQNFKAEFFDGKFRTESYFAHFKGLLERMIPVLLEDPRIQELFLKERTRSYLEKECQILKMLPSVLCEAIYGVTKPKEIEKELKIFGLSKIINFFRGFRILDTGSTNDYLYFGSTFSNQPDGLGILFLKKSKKNTPEYIGGFKDGKKSGKGTLFNTDKDKKKIYSGEFLDDEKHGRGIEFVFVKKDDYSMATFEGIFENGKKSGKGRVYDLKNRSFVYGIWSNDFKVKDLKTFRCPIISYGDVKKHLIQENNIGSGTYGDVFKVKSNQIKLPGMKIKDRFLAVKIMKNCDDVGDRVMMFEMIKRGIELCSDIKDNTNFLETFGVFRNSRQIGCVMRFCKSSIDKEIIRRKGKIKLEKKMKYLLGVASGMMYLHDTNTMHRDLKWGNILLSVDDVIKITDFDTLREDEGSWNLNAATLTAGVGTPGFSAPEIHLGENYGLACDVFSFGIMIYSLLFELNQPYISQFQCHCGVEVRNMLAINSLHTHVAACNFRPLLDPERISKYPRFLIDLMILCWDKEPSKRPSFTDIFHILDSEQRKKKIKSYNLVEFEFTNHKEFFRNDKLLLLPKDKEEFLSKIRTFLTSTKKYEGAKIQNLDCKFGGIYNNEDILNLFLKEDNPIIFVEFSEFKKPEPVQIESTEKEKELEKKMKDLEHRVHGLVNQNKKYEDEIIDLKNEVLLNNKKEKEFDEERDLFSKFLKKKGIDVKEFSKFCEFQNEEIEGEDTHNM